MNERGCTKEQEIVTLRGSVKRPSHLQSNLINLITIIKLQSRIEKSGLWVDPPPPPSRNVGDDTGNKVF